MEVCWTDAARVVGNSWSSYEVQVKCQCKEQSTNPRWRMQSSRWCVLF